MEAVSLPRRWGAGASFAHSRLAMDAMETAKSASG